MALTITTKEGILLMLIALSIGGIVQTFSIAVTENKQNKVYLYFTAWLISTTGFFIIFFPDSFSNIVSLKLSVYMGSINTWIKRFSFFFLSIISFLITTIIYIWKNFRLKKRK